MPRFSPPRPLSRVVLTQLVSVEERVLEYAGAFILVSDFLLVLARLVVKFSEGWSCNRDEGGSGSLTLHLGECKERA